MPAADGGAVILSSIIMLGELKRMKKLPAAPGKSSSAG
jgi:hypothetical protein